MQDQLIFFDKDGFAYNFHWDEEVERYEGKLLFHENSSDTFKTLIINVFERIKPFQYSQNNDLDLEKWQLFNEHGLFFLPKTFSGEDINNIEKVNNSPAFFSKWVYGPNFDSKFPVGTLVHFTGTGIPDFTSGVNLKTFVVVSTKRDAVMVVTATDNSTYASVFVSGQMHSLNAVQIHNYSSLSAWSQPSFETDLYADRKISIVDSISNDGVYTVEDDFIDTKDTEVEYISDTDIAALTVAQDFLRAEIVLKTDRIFVITDTVTFEADRKRIIFASGVPSTLTTGVNFIFDTGLTNSNITYTVASNIFPIWNNTATYSANEIVEYFGLYYRSNVGANIGNLPNGGFWTLYDINWSATTSYFAGNLVQYQGTLYRCLVNNTNINPSSTTYWSTTLLNLYTDQTPINEGPVLGNVYLTTSTLTFDQPFVNSSLETLLTFMHKYKGALSAYNLDTYFDYNINRLYIRRKYPEDYADVDFFTNVFVGPGYTTVNVTNSTTIPNYFINVSEQLIKEGGFKEGSFTNGEISELISYQVEFVNIDSFGLHITINGIEYSVPFDTNTINTLTDWVTLYATTLNTLGINVSNIGSILTIDTDYPNVGLSFNIQLGTTGSYRIKHSDVSFVVPNANFDQLSIQINGSTYFEAFDTNEVTTIANWVNTHQYVLADLGIIVTSSFFNLSFFTKEQNTPLTYTIFTGSTFVDPIFEYTIIDYVFGDTGTILASNQIVNTNPGVDLQEHGFATAMIIAIKNSIWPLNNQEHNILMLDPTRIVLSYQGPFWDDTTSVLTLSAREFLRQPRFGFDDDPQAKIVFEWIDDTTPELFLYDFSGDQLETTGPFAYTGVLPLVDESTQALPDHQLTLKREPNTDLELLDVPRAQQTIFDKIEFDLDLIDSATDLTVEPEALPIFLGFNDTDEGTVENTLKMYFVEDRSLTVDTDPLAPLDVLTFDPDNNQILLTSTTLYFTNIGFRTGQIISVNGFDNTNQYNQAKFLNNGKKFYIKSVFSSILVIDPEKSDTMLAESTLTSITNPQPPFNSIPTGMTVLLNVEPKEMGSFQVYGQTETEDVRLRVALDNVGHNIKQRDIYIFKDYDIQEQGVDWIYLNRKRKEMLLVQPEIFNYVGAYKAVVNAINYFGYNDLQLYEYYRNINSESPNYKKLHKMEIPDVFDPSVKGWNEKDYLSSSFPNKNYKKTRLFNLTYRITDFEGNNVLGYSLDEAIIKLSGLKRWLKENVLPIGTKILDITGRVDSQASIGFQHSANFDRGVKAKESFAPVVFEVEGYKMPVSNGSSLYNLHLDFSTQDGTVPEVWTLNIKTYETHPSWDVNVNYAIGEQVTYFGRIYKSLLNPNLAVRPNADANYWEEQDFTIVQRISEIKTDLDPYNFTADKDADAFIVIEAFSDNGYGANYSFTRFVTLDGIWLLTQKLDPAALLSGFDPGYDTGFGS